MKAEVSIVVVGYRSEKTIDPFLDSIKKTKDDLKKEVILVDNYPQDKTVSIAKKHSLKPVVIANKENIGFAKAVNMGIAKSKGDYILLINPDTRLLGNALTLLVEFAKSTPHLGAVVPRLLNSDGSIQPSCSTFPTITNAIKHDFLGYKKSFKKYNPGNATTTVDVAVMAAFLIPKSVIKQVGVLDERFFLYYEDIEYCRRLKEHGLPVYYFPKAKVKHVHGASGNFVSHLQSPLLKSARTYYGTNYSKLLNIVLWLGHKWQVLLKGKKFRD